MPVSPGPASDFPVIVLVFASQVPCDSAVLGAFSQAGAGLLDELISQDPFASNASGAFHLIRVPLGGLADELRRPGPDPLTEDL